MNQYSLLEEPWIPVLGLDGRRYDVSLTELFAEARHIRMVACELPTQTFAVLRLALAILHRATDGPTEAYWRTLWGKKDMPPVVTEYLTEFADRFDLFDPQRPFYQVADLRTARGEEFGLERVVADLPNGIPYLTSRAGDGAKSMSASEAALWVVHCQAFDTAGIKSGALGDPRVKGSKGYPMGVAAAGWLGGTYVEGANLRETLLLNLVPLKRRNSDERDLPIWEREHPGPAEESPVTCGPYGVLSLYTWQSRRIRLYGDRNRITGAMVAYGDPIEWQDRHLLEPMSMWGRSGPREKAQKKTPVYLPRQHDTTRALWRGLTNVLTQAPSADEPSQRRPPLVMEWLAHLTRIGALERDQVVRPCAVSVAYGSQQSVVDQVFGDSLTMSVQVVQEDSTLRTTVIDCVSDADAAVQALRQLAANLVRAAAGSGTESDAAERAAEAAYARLDRHFRHWLAQARSTTDPLGARTTWQREVVRVAARLAHDLIQSAGPTAWTGRIERDRNGKDVYYCSAQAEAWFRRNLRRALLLASAARTSEEVPV